jgi:hypothetical protein
LFGEVREQPDAGEEFCGSSGIFRRHDLTQGRPVALDFRFLQTIIALIAEAPESVELGRCVQ